MFLRWLSWVIFSLAGALIGGWMVGETGALFGVIAGGALWLLQDSMQLARLDIWLRALQLADQDLGEEAVTVKAPAQGWYSVLAERVRRMLRAQLRARKESQARLDETLAAMQASPNGLVLLDAEGRIEWCNLMSSQHFGLDVQRDLQQYAVNLVRDPAFTAYLAAGDYARPVVVTGSQSTAMRPVRLSVQLHPYGQGRRMMLSRDVTLLEQAEAMRRDFVANVSHEIRTPLTVLAGFVETLQTLPLDEAQRQKYLALMAHQSERMQTLVNDLLTLSRLEGTPLPDAHDEVSLALLMTQCEHEARTLSAQLSSSGHVIEFVWEGDHVLCGAPSELQSAFSNLVTNAVRYTPAPGRILVRWTVLPDGRGEFSVEDSGPGIAPEHLPRLTERFYRVDRSRSRETGGTGLGLAIVKHVVQRHSAELRMHSQVGHGSRFAIEFPPMRLRLRAASEELTSA